VPTADGGIMEELLEEINAEVQDSETVEEQTEEQKDLISVMFETLQKIFC